MIERAPRRILRKTNSGSGVALGIAVNQERALFGEGKGGCQINGSCRLANAAFLIRNCDNAAQFNSPRPRNLSH